MKAGALALMLGFVQGMDTSSQPGEDLTVMPANMPSVHRVCSAPYLRASCACAFPLCLRPLSSLLPCHVAQRNMTSEGRFGHIHPEERVYVSLDLSLALALALALSLCPPRSLWLSLSPRRSLLLILTLWGPCGGRGENPIVIAQDALRAEGLNPHQWLIQSNYEDKKTSSFSSQSFS